jgi:CCR4-NOT transcription complex subunit 7/8
MAHYGQYPSHPQGHAGLPPPSLGGNPSFMNPNSNINPFANGNALSLGQGFSGGGGGLGVGGGTGLASHAAQIGFAHGASLQQQAHNIMGEQGPRGMISKGRIRDVWKSNLQEEMDTIRRLVDKYPYISMVSADKLGGSYEDIVANRCQDTEFPGLVARPMGAFRGKSDYHYQTLRSNVDLLKLIQLGITLFSDEGETTPARPQSTDSAIDMNIPGARKYVNGAPTLPCTWQFNFSFSLKDDMYSQVSIESLQQAGLDFQSLATDGIDPFDFGALLISSGLVCDEDVHWISFHGGYDFGYLTKLMICKPLPDDEIEFDLVMKKFFPSIYDVKFLMKNAIRQNQLGQLTPLDPVTAEVLQKFEQKSSLESLAEILKVKRIGPSHTAGSDALLTGKVFFQMRERIFNGEINREHEGRVWGLGLPEYNQTNPGFAASTPQHYNHQDLQENNTPCQNGNAFANGTPSTPNNGHAGLASTPAPASNATGIGPLTPGGGGGVFGAFQFAK